MSAIKVIRRRIGDERGASLVEYSLAAVFVVAVLLVFSRVLTEVFFHSADRAVDAKGNFCASPSMSSFSEACK